MNRMIIKYKGILIFTAIEAFFYLKFEPKNLEMFFMIWVLISIALLVYNIFNVKYDVPMMSLGDKNSLPHFTGSFLEKIYAKDGEKPRTRGGIRDPINLMYLSFIIVNVIGYMIVMPK